MKRLLVVSGLCVCALIAVSGCKKSSGGKSQCGNVQACGRSLDCPPGESCGASGCCEPFACTPESCGPDKFCDARDGACKTIADVCGAAGPGCECFIDPPRTALPAGGSMSVQAVLAVKQGPPLPGAGFDFTVEPSDSFQVAGGVLTASATAGSATLTATARGMSGSPVDCTASLVNLGAAPSDGNVRVYLFDALTGAPISGATVIVDTDADGLDNGNAAPTDASGTTLTVGLGPGTAYDVTIFKDQYDYLSLVGLDTTAAPDLILPLTPRKSPATTGGFTGKLDFATYVELIRSGSIALGLVAPSFSLEALLSLDLARLLGPMPDAQSCTSTSPPPPGCYQVQLPPYPATWAPLPAGLTLEIAGQPVKAHFDVAAPPGRRYAWSFGFRAEPSEVRDLLGLLTSLVLPCSCNVSAACDAGCSCDPECGLSLDFGRLLGSLTPLFPVFASGTKGNLPLVEAPLETWESYVATDYASRGDALDATFPRLDVGGRGPLAAKERLREFSDFAVPALPPDPAYQSPPDVRAMEGMVVLTGVEAAGYGFVPLGFAIGLDCTASNCLTVSPEQRGTIYDGAVNGAVMCNKSTSLAQDTCLGGAIPELVGNGHVGLFHTKAYGGLEGQPWVTVALALPLNSLAASSATPRATGFITRGLEPPAGAGSDFLVRPYPLFPDMPASFAGRAYAVSPKAGLVVQWVRAESVADKNGVAVGWSVYFAGSGGTFKAPSPPDTSDRCLSPCVLDPFGTVAPDKVSITQIGLSLGEAHVLSDFLAARGGLTLGTIVRHADGFTVQRREY